MMATVLHVTSGWDLENFRPMDFCWHKCTFFETMSARLHGVPSRGDSLRNRCCQNLCLAHTVT